MSIAERRLREKEAVRALIIKASWEIVLRDGWDALSMRKIADAIDYSAPVIYDHFANKEALMLEFAKQGFRKLNKTLNKEKAKHTNPELQIITLAHAYLNFATKNKEYYQLMYGMGMPSCEMIKETEELSAFTEIILDPINNLISKSENKTTDPIMKLQTFWSMLHGLISINRMDNENREDLNETILYDFMPSFIREIKG